jgi:hypothetical protein
MEEAYRGILDTPTSASQKLTARWRATLEHRRNMDEQVFVAVRARLSSVSSPSAHRARPLRRGNPKSA